MGSGQIFPQRFTKASLKRRMGLESNTIHSVHIIQSKWRIHHIASISESPRIFLRMFIR